jgi:DNA-directed RNA polymerase subunit RPC12/RpoP
MNDRRSKTKKSDSNEDDLLKFEFEVIDNPHVNPLVRIVFEGEYPFGSRGTPHGRYMGKKRNDVIKAVSNRYHHLPQGMVFDLSNLHYVWGDMMSTLFWPFPILQSVVAVGETKEALTTLGAAFAGIPPMFELVKDAIQYIETEILRTFTVMCPTCMNRFKGKRLTLYSCPKCNSKLIINLDGKVSIREEPTYKSVLASIDRIKF